jgi:hypothetical protein
MTNAMAVLLTVAGGIGAPCVTWGQTPPLEPPESFERLAPGPLAHLERVGVDHDDLLACSTARGSRARVKERIQNFARAGPTTRRAHRVLQ